MHPDVIVLEPEPWLAVTVETLCADMDATPTVAVALDAADLAATAGPASVLVVGPSSADAAGLRRVAEHVASVPGTEVVLAFDGAPDVPLSALLASGARALVDPADAWELRAAVVSGLDRTRRLREALTVVEQGVEEQDELGKVFTVCSPTGGCGKTFYASNLSYLLAATGHGRVALLDLDLQFGEVSAAMRVRGRHSLVDAVDIRDDDELAAYLPELLVEHESGVLVLPAPRDPAQADRIRPEDVSRVVKALARHVDVVVVDTPTGLTEPVLAALDVSDHLFVLASLDLASLRNLRLFCDTLDRLRIDTDRIDLVLNKEARDAGIDVSDLVKVFPRGFSSRIPFDREVNRLMNHGTPVLQGAEDSAVAAALVEGMLPFLGEAAAATARERWLTDRGVRGFLDRFTRTRRRDVTPISTTTLATTGGNR